MAATLPKWPILRLGNSGPNVYALQFLLVYRGFSGGGLNGTFDERTEAGVKQFQAKYMINDTQGVAGEATLTKLVTPVQQVIVKEEGETIPATTDARAAQYLLRKFESITVDGKFGPGAATALAAFQVRMRIPITGIADSLTWQYMFGYNSYPLSAVTPPSTSVYASVCAGDSTLTSAQRTKNAQYVCNFLKEEGFSKAAVCGVLGNMQQESGINPGIWQFLPSTADGYGLVQWTPVRSKFFAWVRKESLLSNVQPATINNWAVSSPGSIMQNELKYLLWSIKNEDGAWKHSTTSDYGQNKVPTGITFDKFKADTTRTAAELALIFHAYYERSADDSTILQLRERYATNWYNNIVW